MSKSQHVSYFTEDCVSGLFIHMSHMVALIRSRVLNKRVYRIVFFVLSIASWKIWWTQVCFENDHLLAISSLIHGVSWSNFHEFDMKSITI
ncbi:hypothetical protein CsSME_00000045 [Camellia sinensis var. sinensis]